MPDSGPVSWLDKMQSLDGTKWAPGDGKSPTIEDWLSKTGAAYPGMKSYCDAAASEVYFSWCGLTVGYCMASSDIAPVFGTTDTGRFLWAAAWMGWGTPVSLSAPQPGDVVIFDFGGNDHHVSLFVKDNGNGLWSCHGGNQGHAVTLANFPKSTVMGVRRPIPVVSTVAAPLVPAVSTVAVPAAAQRFNACVQLVLGDEGGNDDDPDDPGGRTSRGIEQTEWTAWLLTHPSLPADVFNAPLDQIIAIYRAEYWDKLSCDDLPAGLDYVVFDYGVLSGIGQSARILQGYVGSAVDGGIGPQTIAAAASANVPLVINQISDERITYMEQSKVWSKYGKGWTARVQRVRAVATAMASAAAAAKPAAVATPAIPAAPAPAATSQTPAAPVTPATPPAPPPVVSTQVPQLQIPQGGNELATLIAILLYQRITGQPWPGTVPIASVPATAPQPAADSTSESTTAKPSVQIGAAGLALASLLQVIGTIAPPFSTALGGTVIAAANNATISNPTVGTLATVIPIIVAGLGASNGWSWLSGLRNSMMSAMGSAANKPK
jgi:lysozyme family protein